MRTEEIYSLLASNGTKSFCENYLGMKGLGKETPYDPQS